MEKRAFRVDCLQKWSSIGILIFHCLHSGGSIGIMGARKPCKNHVFLMISVPVLFSISFCFPPHILRLLANRRFTCMRAHILPLASPVFLAQGCARLLKQLRVARNQLFACFAFCLVVVVPWSSLVVPWSSLPGEGSEEDLWSIWVPSGVDAGWLWLRSCL